MGDTKSEIKSKVTTYIAIASFLLTLLGCGVAYGRLSQRVDTLEKKSDQVESTVTEKLDVITKSLNSQTVQIAVLSEKVEQLKKEMSK